MYLLLKELLSVLFLLQLYLDKYLQDHNTSYRNTTDCKTIGPKINGAYWQVGQLHILSTYWGFLSCCVYIKFLRYLNIYLIYVAGLQANNLHSSFFCQLLSKTPSLNVRMLIFTKVLMLVLTLKNIDNFLMLYLRDG